MAGCALENLGLSVLSEPLLVPEDCSELGSGSEKLLADS